MAHPYHHAISSVKKHGGHIEDYLPIHNWFDESKAHFGDIRHRFLRHHTQGIFECEQKFGVVIVNSEGRKIPTRVIGEQHVVEDLGFLATISDWAQTITVKPWMMKPLKIDTEFRKPEDQDAKEVP